MFDTPGIGPEDLAWIRRDQFVYYVELTYQLSDPYDWPRLRHDLAQALTAAFSLDQPPANTPPASVGPTVASRGTSAVEVLDHVRARHDPATDWPTFFDALWEARHHLRDDL